MELTRLGENPLNFLEINFLRLVLGIAKIVVFCGRLISALPCVHIKSRVNTALELVSRTAIQM